MSDIFNLTDTWNASGTAFTAIKMDVTDTASAAGSRLVDISKGGTSQFVVSKLGATLVGDGGASPATGVPGLAFIGATGVGFRRNSTTGAVFTASGADIWFSGASNIAMRSNGIYAWSSSTDPTQATDVQIGRSAAGVMAVNGTGTSVGASIELTELGADPSAPAATKARLYIKDVAGKAALFVRFPTGAVQQISVEP